MAAEPEAGPQDRRAAPAVAPAATAAAGPGRRVLIVVENLPVPFDRRVWLEATTLAAAGYTVSVISPKGRGFAADYEILDGVHVYRHPMPPDGNGPIGYGAYQAEYKSREAQAPAAEKGRRRKFAKATRASKA